MRYYNTYYFPSSEFDRLRDFFNEKGMLLDFKEGFMKYSSASSIALISANGHSECEGYYKLDVDTRDANFFNSVYFKNRRKPFLKVRNEK